MRPHNRLGNRQPQSCMLTATFMATGGSMHHITRHILGLGTGFPGARKFRQLLSVDIHKASDPLALLDQAGALLEGR